VRHGVRACAADCIPAEGDATSHSVAGAWIARALHFALAKQVTVKAVLRRKVKFRRAGQAHDDVVFAETMKPGDPGFAQFVEAWVAELTLVVPLPTLPDAVTAEDAEGALLDVLKVLLVATDKGFRWGGAENHGPHGLVAATSAGDDRRKDG
jgi:hypothetical protein